MLEKFKEIFKGSEIAYGLYAKGDRGTNGKQKGKASIGINAANIISL